MEFWLKREDSNSRFRLPINPSTYTVDYSNTVVTQTNVNGDDINQVTGKKLALYKLEFLLPSRAYKYSCEQAWTFGSTQKHVMDLFNWWTKAKLELDFIITGDKVNKKVIIESYTFSENDGTGDVSISLALREMKYVSSVKATASNIKSNRPRISAGSPVA